MKVSMTQGSGDGFALKALGFEHNDAQSAMLWRAATLPWFKKNLQAFVRRRTISPVI